MINFIIYLFIFVVFFVLAYLLFQNVQYSSKQKQRTDYPCAEKAKEDRLITEDETRCSFRKSKEKSRLMAISKFKLRN